MFYTFTVKFKDGKELEIIDINDFKEPQINEISGIAIQWTQRHLKARKLGFDITTIDQSHRNTILSQKEAIVQPMTSEELYDNKVIKIGLHSIERTFQRVGSIGRSTYIGLIDRIKKADTVIKTQWKGYPQLSYTFAEKVDPEEFKIALSFLLRKNGNHSIKMVTLINAVDGSGSEPMESRLIEDPSHAENFAKMEALFKKS